MLNKRIPLLLVALMLLSVVPLTEGNAGGKYNQSSGCSCHSNSASSAVSVSISGHPTSYSAGTTYTLSISVTGGPSGNNGGFSLEVNKGTLSAGGIGIMAVKVNSAGDSATHTTNSYRSWSVDWIAPASGSGQATLSIAGLSSDGSNTNSGDQWASATYQVPEAGAVQNTPPTATNALLGPTGATTSSTLSLSYTYSDAENDPESGTTIEWYRDGVLITNSGLTAPTTLTSKGQEWYAVITPSDGSDDGTSVTSNVLTIANSIPTIGTPSISPNAPEEADDLSYTVSANDNDQDPLTYETRWLLEGSVISALDDSDTVPSYATRSGENWSMEVRVNDGEATTAWQPAQVVRIGGEITNTPPTVSSVLVGPQNPRTNDGLTFSYIYADSNGDEEMRHEVEWLKNGVIDPVFKGDGVPSTSTQKDQSWQVRIRVNDGTSWSTWVASNTATIANTPPVATSLSISQTSMTTNEEADIEFTQTDVDGDAMSNSDIVWYLDGVRYGALDGSFSLTSDHTKKGDEWTVEVRTGDGVTLSDNTLTHSLIVVNSAPAVEVELNQNPSAENPLSATVSSSDPDNDPQTIDLQWYRNGFLEASLTNQTSVPTQLLGPGQEWSVEATANDGEVNSPTIYRSVTVQNLAPTGVIDSLISTVWIGEIITLDASLSSDIDGHITSYQWSWSDVTGQAGSGTGVTFSFMPIASTSVNLQVTDEFGATNTANLPLLPVQGPTINALEATLDGQSVQLTWSYDGPNASFAVERNGLLIDTVQTSTASDVPLTSGNTTYTIRPIIGGTSLQDGATESVTVQVIPVIESIESGVTFTGSLLGFILLLIGAGALGFIAFERRE